MGLSLPDWRQVKSSLPLYHRSWMNIQRYIYIYCCWNSIIWQMKHWSMSNENKTSVGVSWASPDPIFDMGDHNPTCSPRMLPWLSPTIFNLIPTISLHPELPWDDVLPSGEQGNLERGWSLSVEARRFASAWRLRSLLISSCRTWTCNLCCADQPLSSMALTICITVWQARWTARWDFSWK